MAARAVAILLSGLALASCAYRPDGKLLTGNWGGARTSLSIDAGGHAEIRMGCGSAAFDGPTRLDVGGHWLRPGTYTQGSGAPPPEPPRPVPATISGRLDRDGTLWMSIATLDGLKVNNDKLARNREPGFAICP